MSSLKASPEQLQRIQQARIDRPSSIDNPKWLLAASKILKPEMIGKIANNLRFRSGVGGGF